MGLISQDPIGFAAGDTNVSRYVGNGVTGATDPSGLELFVDGNAVAKTDGVYDDLTVGRSLGRMPIPPDLARQIVDGYIDSQYTWSFSEAVLADNIEARYSIVHSANYFARMIDSGKLRFGDFMDLAEGRKPKALSAVAAQKIITKRVLAGCTTECRQATEMVWFHSLRRWLGDARFNQVHADPRYTYALGEIGTPRNRHSFPTVVISHKYAHPIVRNGPTVVPIPHPTVPGWRYLYRDFVLPGDRVQFLNPGADDPWGGENAIYIGVDDSGEPQYFAHPFGIVTADTILAELADAFVNQGQPGEPAPYLDHPIVTVDFSWYQDRPAPTLVPFKFPE